MAEETAIPTTDSTVAEIKAYLDEKGIAYKSSATKSELLDLVNGDVTPDEAEPVAPDEPVDQPEPVETPTEPVQPPVDTVVEPAPEPVHVEPYYTKAELVGLVGGRLRDYFNLALANDRTYTYAEATQVVDAWKNSASMF